MNQLVFFVYATRKIDSVCRNLFDDHIQSRKSVAFSVIITAACENRLLFPFKEKSSKKGAVKIEENQKLYKHMERGESYLCNQRLSAPVPVTFSQMAWFVLSLLIVILFGSCRPFP